MREKGNPSHLCLPSGFWLLASGPSPNFFLSQSPSAAPVVLFRVRYSSAARVLCPFLVFFSLSLSPISDFDFDFDFSLFSFFFGVVWSLVLFRVGFCEEACFHFLDQQLFHSALLKAYLRKYHPLPCRLHESDFRERHRMVSLVSWLGVRRHRLASKQTFDLEVFKCGPQQGP